MSVTAELRGGAAVNDASLPVSGASSCWTTTGCCRPFLISLHLE
eukprot:CAMPEP_0114154424 /NCGR_PEP_ID=MMETSP0043_2-20121206/24897_1 /TAXON_ID=464988 /ORGANISM="Hemiselmis andersenii, Strain CCMP644" /LENGTH=43 /DNA_ID= /DNA_START= /DNA_END= /DNA_ORIENTATION=